MNRLLLYPQSHPLVEQWALERYENHELNSRLSDVVALLLPRYGIKKFKGLDPDSVAWSIIKSRIDHSAKLGLLREIIDNISTPAVMDIAKRLDSPELIELCLGKM